ncbi:HMA2 domain-containing protein [Rhodobium gokarnense]|uniref:HMA domain-containing protein n=1 Tax=Rhodobium gokarnense TaxID=364296 RepID=A0ABT3H975_9HYPH|nr:hypothetical protein [Rhodobium gokarnense]MCW2306957.1 hypothetical protein [Rhodobium gokarnense]
MSQYVHHVPGRLRVRCKTMRADAAKLREIALAMEDVPGVRSIRTNPQSGSIILGYDGEITDRDTLLAALDGLGCSAEYKTPNRTGPRTVNFGGSSKLIGETVTRTLVSAVVGTVVKSTVEPKVLTLLKLSRIAR